MWNKNKMMRWIEKSLKTDQFSIDELKSGEKGDGYVGDVHFIKVILNDPKEKEKELFLVVKVTKTEQIIRELSSVLSRIEVVFYSEVFPVFNKFLQEKNIKEPFTAVPKCYTAFIEEDTNVVVIEDLRVKGYEVNYANYPTNLNIIKLVFKTYAKYHAISFALRDQRKDHFRQIEEKLKNSTSNVIDQFKPMYDKVHEKGVNYLIEAGEKDLAQKVSELMEKGCYNNVKNCIVDIPEERVVIHGDGHCHNLLFKFQDGNKENPLAMSLIDFQLSGMQSPMADLGYFWYCAVQTREQCSHFKELMEFYYKELSSSAAELGTDISGTFPISKMWEHWKKYSLFGFMTAVAFLDVFYSEKDLELTYMMDDTDEIKVKINDKSHRLFLERLAAVVDHHFNFNP